MPSLDTNCLLRLVLMDVPEQTARVEGLLADGRVFCVADETVLETIFVLERHAGLARPVVHDAIEALMAEAAIDIDRPLWREVLTVYVARPKLSVTDICVALKAARRGRAPLYTFDKKMLSQLPGCATPPAPDGTADT